MGKLSTPLYSYVEKAGAIASPVVDCAFTVKAGIEGKMPEMIQTGITSAKGQVVAAAVSVDASLCSGVDTLVEKVPALKQATPALYNTTKEGVSNYAYLGATYMASFTLANVLLKASDLGLETADRVLKWTSPLLKRKLKTKAVILGCNKSNLGKSFFEFPDSNLVYGKVCEAECKEG